MTDDERMHRADEARAVLENKAFKEAVAVLESHYIEAWRQAKTVDVREDAHRYVSICSKIVSDIRAMLLDGELTRKRVKELAGRKSLW